MKTVTCFGSTLFLVSFLLFWVSEAKGEIDLPDGEISQEGRALLQRGMGVSDDADPRRIAREISIEDLLLAIYGDSHSQRLQALDVAGYLEDPWPLLPYLVAFMEARERRAASTASISVIRSLERIAKNSAEPPDTLDSQIEQLVQELFAVAKNSAVEIDLRVTALESVGMLGRISRREIKPEVELLEDEEPFVRGAAMSMLDIPLDSDMLPKIARIASGDQWGMLRGQAVALLCENALRHGVAKPSADLESLIMSLVTEDNEAHHIAPILGCMAQFSPEARAQIIDRVQKHPNKKLSQYWDLLQKQ